MSIKPNIKKTKQKWKTYFQSQWSKQHDWIARVKNDETRFRCTWCEKEYKLSNMGIQAVNNHIKSKFYFI